MPRRTRLSPPRPSRGELFVIAESYLEDQARTFEGGAPRQESRNAASTSPNMFGLGMAIFFREAAASHRLEKRKRLDRARLMAELACRDLDDFTSIDQLALHVVANEQRA